ncbi:MAG: APC family permease, partial [Terracidiphilus sp.]
VMHWKRQGGATRHMIVNGVGALATGVTTLVVLVAKFAEGAWITALLVIVMILFMRAVNRHYVRVNREIDLDRPFIPAEVIEPIVVVPIDRWSRITEKALSFALSMSCDIHCVHVETSDVPDSFCDTWEKDIETPLKAAGRCVPKLVKLKSPFRYVLYPIVDYVLSVERERENCKVCVLVPELVVRHWWEGMLHNRRSDLLKVVLLVRGNRRIIVINIPWYLGND